VQEDHARSTREIEHMVGLHQQRVEQEIDLATKQAKLDVEQSNLDADKKRFQEQMDFNNKRFEAHLEDVKGMLSTIAGLVPKVTVDRQIDERWTNRPDEPKDE
jgi:hypothetical protein